MLKLVRYKVLFVKREYEHAFEEQEDLVSENLDGAAFTAWKTAEFIQRLAEMETRVPEKWGSYWRGKNGTGESTGRRSSRTVASRNICSDCRMKIKSICGSITRCWIGIHAKDSIRRTAN